MGNVANELGAGGGCGGGVALGAVGAAAAGGGAFTGMGGNGDPGGGGGGSKGRDDWTDLERCFLSSVTFDVRALISKKKNVKHLVMYIYSL